MKNSELARLEGIMKYKEELNKIKPLTQDTYTVEEAAKYFLCARSQVKGYHSNYKDIFGDTIVVEGSTGKQRTIISKDGMYLMAILLSKKSIVAKELFDKVLSLVSGEKQESFEEVASTVENVTKEKEEKDTTVKTDNVVNFEDLKKIKESKDAQNKEVKCIELSIGPDGIKVNPVKMKKKDADKLAKETIDKMNSENELDAMLANFANSIFEGIVGQATEESLEDIAEPLRDCQCEECLSEEYNKACHAADLNKLALHSTLDLQLIVTEKYLNICNLLGIDEVDASILIQKSIVERSEDIDKDILNYLTKKKEKENIKKLGILKESVKLLAEEKFDSEKEAYMALAQEMRYFTGSDLTALVEEECYTTILAKIIETNEFEKAMIIIHQFLAE